MHAPADHLFELLWSLQEAAKMRSKQLGREFRPLLIISVHGGRKFAESRFGQGAFGQLFHVINQICWTPSILLWEPGPYSVKDRHLVNATGSEGDSYPPPHRARQFSANDRQGKSRARRLKRYWFVRLERDLFSHRSGALDPDYQGDVLFLEDDLVVSPDFFWMYDSLSRAKREGRGRDEALFVGSGGWGGENTIGAEFDTFMQKRSANTPVSADLRTGTRQTTRTGHSHNGFNRPWA